MDSAEANWSGNEVRWEQEAQNWDLAAHLAELTPVEFVLPFAPEAVRSLRVNGTEQPVQPSLRVAPCTELDIQITLASASC